MHQLERKPAEPALGARHCARTFQTLSPQSYELRAFISHFTDGGTGSKMLSNWSKSTRLVTSRRRLSVRVLSDAKPTLCTCRSARAP